MQELEVPEVRPEDIVPLLTKQFLEKRTDEWVVRDTPGKYEHLFIKPMKCTRSWNTFADSTGLLGSNTPQN